MSERDLSQQPPPRTVEASSDSPTVAWTPPRNDLVDDASAVTPAEPVRTGRRSRGRLRWAVALLVTVLVVAVGAAAVLLLTGQSAPSTIVGYAPKESVAYGEIRLDLPGDQKQQLGQFLSKFPGFADQSTLDLKIDDVLDRVVRAATKDKQDWTTKIKPWFGGELGFAVGGLPVQGRADDARGLVMLSVTDAGRARAWFDEVTADVAKTTSSYNGVDLTVAGADGKQGAMAIHGGKVMLVGDEQSVKAAIDSGGRSGIDTAGGLADALASVKGDSLGYAFFDLERYAAWLEEAAGSIPGASAIPVDQFREMLPKWLLLRAQARGDALAFETVMPHTTAISAAGENRVGVLAQHVPPSTVLLLDGHEAGKTLRQAIEKARQEPANAEAMRQLDQIAALLGGVDGLIGWIGDAGLAVARDGDAVSGGLLFTPTDRADAERLLTTIRSFAQLGGSSMGITVRDEDYNGSKIGIIDAGDFRDLAALAGGGAVPPGTPLPEGRLEIAYVATDDIVAVGIGTTFIHSVIDAAGGASLADDARYKALLDKVGASNTGSAWLDVAAIRELVERLGPTDPEGFAAYERDVKPYLLPIDALVQAIVRDGDLDRTTTTLTVK